MATQKKRSSTLEITEVRIFPTKSKKAGNLLASANVCFNDSLVINGIKLVDGKKGMFISMPNKEVDGKYYDTAYIMEADDKDALHDAIIDAYEAEDLPFK